MNMNSNEHIRRVVQEEPRGCGIACVAMVAGMNYQAVRNYFARHIFLPRDRKPHTRHYQLCRALHKMGIKTEKRRFDHWRSIDTNAIVPINRQIDGGWHWIVFVSHPRMYILDPAKEKKGRRYDFRGLNARGYYIAIIR